MSARSGSEGGISHSARGVGGPPVDSSKLKLAPHLVAEARRLAADASTHNPVSEPTARALVQSTAVWLMRQGVISKSEHPGVIDEAGTQLHAIIPLEHLKGSKGGKPTTFAHRIDVFLGNHVRFESGTWRIEVAQDTALNTPMRALDEAGYVKRVDNPAQGHSGQSILGKGRNPPTDNLPSDAVVQPLKFPDLDAPSVADASSVAAQPCPPAPSGAHSAEPHPFPNGGFPIDELSPADSSAATSEAVWKRDMLFKAGMLVEPFKRYSLVK